MPKYETSQRSSRTTNHYAASRTFTIIINARKTKKLTYMTNHYNMKMHKKGMEKLHIFYKFTSYRHTVYFLTLYMQHEHRVPTE
jgi:hypothetical protein